MWYRGIFDSHVELSLGLDLGLDLGLIPLDQIGASLLTAVHHLHVAYMLRSAEYSHAPIPFLALAWRDGVLHVMWAMV